MLIVFDSKTGNVQRFASKLGRRCLQLTDDLTVNEPFVLITYTTGFGQAPQSTMAFLGHNGHLLQAVAASGNMNWGTRYGLAADRIADLYEVPVLIKFELSGTKKDVEHFNREVDQLVYATVKLDSA